MGYLDNAATTPLNTAAISAMTHVMTETFGNPSSLHAYGRQASKELREAREEMAKRFEVPARKLIFTSGGTESNNLAVRGACRARGKRAGQIITSALEHPSVTRSVRGLKREGWPVSYVEAGGGNFDLAACERFFQEDTI